MSYLLTEKKSISVSHAKLWIQEMLAHLKMYHDGFFLILTNDNVKIKNPKDQNPPKRGFRETAKNQRGSAKKKAKIFFKKPIKPLGKLVRNQKNRLQESFFLS